MCCDDEKLFLSKTINKIWSNAESEINVNEYKIGELQKGDEIKIVASNMRGDGNVKVLLTNTSITGRETCLNGLYLLFFTPGICTACCPPCSLYSLVCPEGKPTVPAIEETTITYEGEEKTFTVPEDGVYYIDMEAEGGNVIYKGYIGIIKT